MIERENTVKKIGRYKNVKAGKNQKKVSLSSFIGQTGVYNVNTVISKLKEFTGQTSEIEIVDGNGDYGQIWYKGWLIIEE